MSNKLKKVLILADVPIWTLPGLEPYQRGGHYATWLKSLIPEFEAACDLDIHWVVCAKNVGEAFTHRAYGQTFHILPRWKKLVSMLTAYYSEVRQIQKLCNDLKPDMVHAWGSEDVYGWACSRLKFEGPKLFTLQGCLGEYVRKVGGSAIFRLQAAYEKPTIRSFFKATAESPQAAELLREIQQDIDVEIIDYGVDQLFHDQVWQPCEEPTLVMVGAVTQRKGSRETIEAFARPELQHVKLQIIGEGDLLDELKGKSTANVQWLGKLDREQVAAKVSEAWAFLMPTYSDTGPTVVKEARVVGLPVITTTAAGASCYIENGKSGFVIEPKDVAAIVQSVLKLTESSDLCRAMGEFDWQLTKKRLRSSATESAFADVYKEIMTRVER